MQWVLIRLLFHRVLEEHDEGGHPARRESRRLRSPAHDHELVDQKEQWQEVVQTPEQGLPEARQLAPGYPPDPELQRLHVGDVGRDEHDVGRAMSKRLVGDV